MQLTLAEYLRGTPDGEDAQAVLRKCVHCGFCLPACPTYRVRGDELDSPRGRLYLMKELLEGARVTATTRLHLDRCLTCRSCETACPSGVEYHRALEVARGEVERRAPRGPAERLTRAAVRALFASPRLMRALAAVARLLRPLLPALLRRRVGVRGGEWPAVRHVRRMVVLGGCVQGAFAPRTNAALARLLDRAGVSPIEAGGCCGALRFHNGDPDGGREDARRLVDAWWPYVEAGAEAILVAASGCGAHLRELPRLLSSDAAYARKAARVGGLLRDPVEVLEPLAETLLGARARASAPLRVAFQAPCTLQHALRVSSRVELLLAASGCELLPVADAGQCCGSAGTYSLFQPRLARELRTRKLAALGAHGPERIATANVGCQVHLAGGTDVPVVHWLELLEERSAGGE